ncbi:MAG: HD domain-containing protein [Anaerolineae bacterium]|nr:HD domain-containing protein [Anaerolineae bacterium]
MATAPTAVSLPPSLAPLISPYLSAADQETVAQAYALAAQAHAGFFRHDGSPYLAHVTAVAAQLAHWYAPAPVLAAALLHDVRKPTYAAGIDLARVTAVLGYEVAQLVENVSRLGRLGAPYSTDYPDSSQDRMAQVADQLPWVALMLQRSPLAVVIKIADKLHNFASLTVLPEARQLDFANGVMSIFAPFAERLGMRIAKRQLEDYAFAVLQPALFADLQRRYPEAARQAAAQPIMDRLHTAFAGRSFPAQLFTRHRSLFDMHHLEAVAQKEIPLHLADPLIVICPDEAACYQALGVVHALWTPQPGQIWDYIAAPRPNGYRGLHTRVHLDEGEWLSVVIRDEAMDVAAEYGVTAVWRGVSIELQSPFPAWQEPPAGKIGVLTPIGDFISLPVGATPVDFAYAIHMGLGHQCTGALVNGKQVTLDQPLENGDVVRILTGAANVGPPPEWLNFAKTARARSAIRRWLKAQKPQHAAESGWQKVDEALRPAGLTLSAPNVMNRLTAVARQLGFESRDALLLAAGLNQVDLGRLLRLMQETAESGDDPAPLHATIVSLAEADMSQRLAACCRPAPPDAIVGYVTKSGVLSIHRANCYKVRHLGPLIQAEWPLVDSQPRAEIQLLALDRPGLVRDVSQIMADADINMTSFHADRLADGSARIVLGLGEIPRWRLDRLVAQLEGIQQVRQVERRAPTLSGQLMHDSVLARHFDNPYTLRPVSGAGFYGRRRELRELINNLRDVRPGEAVLLWGPRRIGKTSLLLEFQQRVMASQDYVLVFLDMQRLSGRSTTIFIRDILRAVAQAIGHPEVTPRINRLRRDPLGYFRSFLDNNPYLRDKQIVMIIDEFQLLPHLTEEEVSLADINLAFRSLIQHRGGLSIIFSGGGVLDSLLSQPDASFMLEVARYQKVDCLDEPAARQLIVEPAQRVTYTPTAVDNLLALTARHPYYLQWLCGELMARADREERQVIADEDVERLLAEWLPEQGEQFFNHLWGSSAGLTRPQQFLSKLALVTMAGSTEETMSLAEMENSLSGVLVDTPRLWYVLQDLAQMDTVTAVGERYVIKMPLFRRWLQANYTIDRVLKERTRGS